MSSVVGMGIVGQSAGSGWIAGGRGAGSVQLSLFGRVRGSVYFCIWYNLGVGSGNLKYSVQRGNSPVAAALQR